MNNHTASLNVNVHESELSQKLVLWMSN